MTRHLADHFRLTVYDAAYLEARAAPRVAARHARSGPSQHRLGSRRGRSGRGCQSRGATADADWRPVRSDRKLIHRNGQTHRVPRELSQAQRALPCRQGDRRGWSWHMDTTCGGARAWCGFRVPATVPGWERSSTTGHHGCATPRSSAEGFSARELVARSRLLLGKSWTGYVVRSGAACDPVRFFGSTVGGTYNGINDKIALVQTGFIQSSLRLVHVGGLGLCVFKPGEAFGNSKRRVQGRFRHGADDYHLWVTDPVYERAFLSKPDGDYGLGECFLTVSLGEPHNDACYKLIAAIIERDTGTRS